MVLTCEKVTVIEQPLGIGFRRKPMIATVSWKPMIATVCRHHVVKPLQTKGF